MWLVLYEHPPGVYVLGEFHFQELRVIVLDIKTFKKELGYIFLGWFIINKLFRKIKIKEVS